MMYKYILYDYTHKFYIYSTHLCNSQNFFKNEKVYIIKENWKTNEYTYLPENGILKN